MWLSSRAYHKREGRKDDSGTVVEPGSKPADWCNIPERLVVDVPNILMVCLLLKIHHEGTETTKENYEIAQYHLGEQKVESNARHLEHVLHGDRERFVYNFQTLGMQSVPWN